MLIHEHDICPGTLIIHSGNNLMKCLTNMSHVVVQRIKCNLIISAIKKPKYKMIDVVTLAYNERNEIFNLSFSISTETPDIENRLFVNISLGLTHSYYIVPAPHN